MESDKMVQRQDQTTALTTSFMETVHKELDVVITLLMVLFMMTFAMLGCLKMNYDQIMKILEILDANPQACPTSSKSLETLSSLNI